MNILIPMAGAGSRFEEAGYKLPKPFILIDNKPMIQIVVENLNLNGKHIFICQKSHRQKYELDKIISSIIEDYVIYEIDGMTEGAACTTLIAKNSINNKTPLLIANSDQYLEWNSNDFLNQIKAEDADGGILTFKANGTKWSFVKLDNNNKYVIEVAEKKQISDIATAGIYYWKNGSDYVKYAEEMIRLNHRHNNEFYVCPVFNEAIKENKKFVIHGTQKMYGLGTPEDLKMFLSQRK